MAQPQLLQIKLSRFDAQPWGFRLQGGVDYAAPLLVQKVNAGSLAEQAGLQPGDAVIKINDVDVFNMKHKDAQDIVVRSGNTFVMTVQRGGSTWRPHVTPTGNVPQPNSPYLQTVTKTSLAHKQQDSQHIGCGYNNAARPFTNGGDGSVKSIVNKQYNTPVGIYSDESIAETLSAQAEVLAGGVLGVNFKKNEKEYQADKSEVLKFLREEESGHPSSTPAFNNQHNQELSHQQNYSQQQQQHYQQQQHQPSATRHVNAPVNTPKPPSTGGLPTGQNICQECERLITGVFVRIKDKNLHVECFRCATCGTSLKNQGYYNFNNKLYCEIHAKLAAMQNPPAGTEGYVPVPIKPNTKLSANTVSAALNAHGFNNGVSNGTSTPTPAPVENPLASTVVATAVDLVTSEEELLLPPPPPENIENNLPTQAAVTNPTENLVEQNINNFNNQANQNCNMSSGLIDDQPIYGQINGNANNNGTPFTSQSMSSEQQQSFEYVTLTGNVIRSVVPPGKGVNINYKVNQGYARPFGAAATPPSAAPKSPISYPPQQQQQWSSPASNPYATLPRTNAGQQESEECLQPQYAEECIAEELELEQCSRQKKVSLIWPPPRDDGDCVPTAAPLYIPPPETQHVVPKNIDYVPPLPPGGGHSQPNRGEGRQLEQQRQEQGAEQQQLSANQQHHWQSRSAPQLTAKMQVANGIQAQELETSSDSYTSTSTTTTTTSEEYQRMFAAQIQAYHMQQAYEQSGSEYDYNMDMELAGMHRSQDIDYCQSSGDNLSGRRSVQECAESLAAPLNTYKLVDMVREVTPSPVPPSSTQGPRHVVFSDEPQIKEVPKIVLEGEHSQSAQPWTSEESQQIDSSSFQHDTASEEIDLGGSKTVSENPSEDFSIEQYRRETASEEIDLADDKLVIEDRSKILESQRLFQPTPEIIFDIPPPGRQIPPTKIPNPMPKEWINPMIRVLTTAPEVPFHLVECPFPKPCEASCEMELTNDLPQPQRKQSQTSAFVKKDNPETEPEQFLRDLPPSGSYLTKAMSTAPEFPVHFVPPASQPIPLPEETEPYMPPPMDMKPFLREDYRPKSPFLSALTTAPEKPFEGQFDRDVPIHGIDLPTPKEHLSMSDALRIASDRPYTPLNPENATQMFEEKEKAKERKKYEFQVLGPDDEGDPIEIETADSVEYYTTERNQKQERKSSAFAAMQAFQPSKEPLTPNAPRKSISSTYTQDHTDVEYEKYCKAKERNQKRLDFYHKKEEELQQQLQNPLQSQPQTQTQPHLQPQTQAQTIKPTQNQSQPQPQSIQPQPLPQPQQETNQAKRSSISSYTKENISKSSTVQQQLQEQLPNSTIGTSPYVSNTTQASSMSSSYCGSTCKQQQQYHQQVRQSTKMDVHEIVEETSEELEHSDVLFPPPSPLSHLKHKTVQSGLHKPESIPKYQRNWTVLPTQSPVRTPEPLELRENVPLAFVDTPKNPCNAQTCSAVHKPVAQQATITQRAAQQQGTSASSTVACGSRMSLNSSSLNTSQNEANGQRYQSQPQPQQQQQQRPSLVASVPVISDERSGPISMAFQSLDDYEQQTPQEMPRAYTPSLTNRVTPVTPYYQTPEKLCFEECSAQHARTYDQRSASPFPDRARSPAPGPPPNPLSAIRAPRIKDKPEPSRLLQTGSITTGQSYLGAQQIAQQQQQGEVLSHFEASAQSGMQSFTQKPETFEETKIGDLTIQKRAQESRLEEQKQKQMQSQTKTQIGNTQIERRRKVTEEFEHTQSAKTIEIRTGTQSQSTERRQSYGKTGFVADQARRLSNLEQEINNLSTQSAAISAKALTLSDSRFPEFHSPTPESRFPTSPLLPGGTDPQPPSYIVTGKPESKMVFPPPGLTKNQQQAQKMQQISSSNMYNSSMITSQQKQQQQILAHEAKQQYQAVHRQQHQIKEVKQFQSVEQTQQQQQQKSYSGFTLPNVSTSLSSASAPTSTSTSSYTAQSNANSSSLTQASASTNINTNQAFNSINGNNNFCPQMERCCKVLKQHQQQQQQLQAKANINNNFNNQASAGFKTTLPATAPKPVTVSATPTASSIPPSTNVSDINSLDDSAGAGGKTGGAYGATSAPKRGRGILNKASAPGTRVPLCNSCNMQIRGPFITALGRIWCPDHFICINANCRRPLQDIGFVEEKGDLYCEYCFEKYLAPTCCKCGGKIKGDCLNAIGKHFHPECFNCAHCGKLFGNTPFFLEDGNPYCEADWNELFTTKCFACGFPVEAGDRWVEALNHNYHSQCFNCTFCKQNLEGQSFYNKGGRPFCKNHAR